MSTTPDMIDPAQPKPGSAEGTTPFDPLKPKSQKLGPVALLDTAPATKSPPAPTRPAKATRDSSGDARWPPDGHRPHLEEGLE